MNADMVEIGAERLAIALKGDPNLSDILEFTHCYSSIHEGRLDGRTLGVLIFSPIEGNTTATYAWVSVTEFGHQHKLSIGRIFKRKIAWAHTKYKTIYAHCADTKANRAWIQFTNAAIILEQSNVILYAMVAEHG